MKLLLLLIFIGLISCNTGIIYPAGGYDYPEHVADKDTNFYYYPLKDKETAKDSFKDALASKTFYFFDEPNLSIRPKPKPVFRFTYEGWTQKTTIILLSENVITVKQASPSAIYDYGETRLNNIESIHLSLLRRYFPINLAIVNQRAKHYVDSMVKTYPQLLDPVYFRALEEKNFTVAQAGPRFSITHISVAKDTFTYLVNLINQSGFWALPDKMECQEPPTDGYSFLLEANTEKKYKLVTKGGCPGDTSNFVKACQKLVEFAHLEKDIDVVWNMSPSKESPPLIIKDVQLEEIKQPKKKKRHHTSPQ